MPIRVDETQLAKNDRPAAIAMALFTLRLMDHWKQEVDDYDCAMIMVAVVVITGERLLKTELEPSNRSLEQSIERSRLRKCNIASIAQATGINRETARRKINDLIGKNLLVRIEDGSIALRPGLVQEPTIRALVQRQVGEVAALANQLEKIHILA